MFTNPQHQSRALHALSGMLFGAVIVAVPFSRLLAQHSPVQTGSIASASWGAIDGSIRDTSGAWMRGVEVLSIDNTAIRTRSGAGGAFRLDSISAGPHLIRFRRIGILPLTVSVVVEPNSITSVDAVVEPFPLTLSRITIQAASGELVNLPAGVADRMRTGIGTYITGAEIAKMNPRQTLEVFRHVPGLEVDGRPGEEVVSNTRGRQTLNGDSCAEGMLLVLNGVPLQPTVTTMQGFSVATDTLTSVRPPSNNAALGVLNTIAPRDIAAIEIYSDAMQTPVKLTNSQCGAIFVWTRQ